MDFSVMRAYTRRLLAEEVAAESFWLDATIDSFNNESYRNFVSLSEILQCDSKADSKAAAAATMPEDGEYANPIDTLRILRVFVKDPTTAKWGKPLTGLTYEEMDREKPDGWLDSIVTGSEKPTFWVPRGQMFHLVPAHNVAAIKNILLQCVQSPATLSGTQIPLVPEGYHEAICYGGAARALEADRGSAENDATYRKFMAHFTEGVLLAKSQDSRKKPIYGVRDIRDFYTTESEWRG